MNVLVIDVLIAFAFTSAMGIAAIQATANVEHNSLLGSQVLAFDVANLAMKGNVLETRNLQGECIEIDSFSQSEKIGTCTGRKNKVVVQFLETRGLEARVSTVTVFYE